MTHSFPTRRSSDLVRNGNSIQLECANLVSVQIANIGHIGTCPLRSALARSTFIRTAQFKRLLMKQVDQFMARKRKAEHRSVSDTCWLAVERANDAEHRATRRTVNPSAGSMIEQRGNTHSKIGRAHV